MSVSTAYTSRPYSVPVKEAEKLTAGVMAAGIGTRRMYPSDRRDQRLSSSMG